jgi:endonuclease G
MPVLTAGNVDYENAQRGGGGRASFGKDEWIPDTRMDDAFQIPAGFYDRWKKLDYGHLVRREDNCWGASKKEIEYANSDTFHLTNCTPQHEAYNRSNEKGLWGLLENAIGSQSKKDKAISRLCVFAGPIFDDKKDLVCKDEAGEIRVPLAFWKVVVAPLRKGGIGAYGFILSQAKVLADATPFEDFVPPDTFKHEQASLAAIEAQTIVRFDKRLKTADVLSDRPAGNERLELDSVEDLVFH